MHLSRPLCTQAQEMGAFPQPRRDSAVFPLYPSATVGPRGNAGEGAHYQSGPGKSNQAARAAPLPINAFTPSKPFQCKPNPFRRPMGEKAHPGRPEALPLPTCSRAKSWSAPPGRRPPGKRSLPPAAAAAAELSCSRQAPMATAPLGPAPPPGRPLHRSAGPGPPGRSPAAGAAERGAVPGAGRRRQRERSRSGQRGAPSGQVGRGSTWDCDT